MSKYGSLFPKLSTPPINPQINNLPIPQNKVVTNKEAVLENQSIKDVVSENPVIDREAVSEDANGNLLNKSGQIIREAVKEGGNTSTEVVNENNSTNTGREAEEGVKAGIDTVNIEQDKVRGSGIRNSDALNLLATYLNKPISQNPAYQRLYQETVAAASDEPYEMQVAKKNSLAANTRANINQNQTTDATLNSINSNLAQSQKLNMEMQDLAQRSATLRERRDIQRQGEDRNREREVTFNNQMNLANEQADLQKRVADRQWKMDMANQGIGIVERNEVEAEQKQMANNQYDEAVAQNQYGQNQMDMRGEIGTQTAQRDALSQKVNYNNALIKHYEAKGLDKLTPEEKKMYDEKKIELDADTKSLGEYGTKLEGLNKNLEASSGKFNQEMIGRRNNALNSTRKGVINTIFGKKKQKEVYKKGGTLSVQERKDLMEYKEILREKEKATKMRNEIEKINLEYAKLTSKIKQNRNKTFQEIMKNITNKGK